MDFNFYKNIANNADSRKKLNIASDQLFSPLSCFDLYQIIKESVNRDLKGLYNCGGPDSLSRYDYALSIYKEYGISEFLNKCSLSDFSGTSNVPRDVTMNSKRLYEALEYIPLTFQDYVTTFQR